MSYLPQPSYHWVPLVMLHWHSSSPNCRHLILNVECAFETHIPWETISSLIPTGCQCLVNSLISIRDLGHHLSRYLAITCQRTNAHIDHVSTSWPPLPWSQLQWLHLHLVSATRSQAHAQTLSPRRQLPSEILNSTVLFQPLSVWFSYLFLIIYFQFQLTNNIMLVSGIRNSD